MMIDVIKMIQRLISRATIKQVSDGQAIRRLQVRWFGSWVQDDVEHAEPFGLTARPPVDAQAVCAQISGDPDATIALHAIHPASRPTDLNSGDTCLYAAHADAGEIRLVSDGIDIGGGDAVRIAADATELNGSARTIVTSDLEALILLEMAKVGVTIDLTPPGSAALDLSAAFLPGWLTTALTTTVTTE